MSHVFKVVAPYVFGGIAGAILYFFPEHKHIACGIAAGLPALAFR